MQFNLIFFHDDIMTDIFRCRKVIGDFFHSDKRIDDFHRITFEDGKLIVTIDIGRSTNVRVTDEDRYSR